MKLVSVVSPCYDEEENVRELYTRVREVFTRLGTYRYEHIFIDNASRDGTARVLREIASADRNVKVILNRRNFGQVRSPHHALLQSRGEATICMAADLQDPPELIARFLEKWEQGFKVVLGVKKTSEESRLMFAVRTLYYRLIDRISDVRLIQHVTGFGLFDKEFIDMIRQLDDPYPYTRGLVSEFGFECATIPYDQPTRKHGLTKNNFFSLYDVAMTGITSHSKLPLRLATITGFCLSGLSLLVAGVYFFYKLLFWNSFPVGIAPIVIGLFLALSVQLFFLGLLGEYVVAIHTRVLKRPLVVERERINFDEPPAGDPGPGG